MKSEIIYDPNSYQIQPEQRRAKTFLEALGELFFPPRPRQTITTTTKEYKFVVTETKHTTHF